MIDHPELDELDHEAPGMLAPLIQTFETVNVCHVMSRVLEVVVVNINSWTM